jgi:hypothetical protein
MHSELHRISSQLNRLFRRKNGDRSPLGTGTAYGRMQSLPCDTTRQTIEVYRNDELFELPESIRTQLHQAVLTKCEKLKRKKESQA